MLSALQKSFTWSIDAAGNWSLPANWLAPIFPNNPLVSVSLGPIITANRTITVDVAISIGALTINDNNNYTIVGSSNLTFSSLTTAGSGFPTISAPMRLTGILTFNCGTITTLSGVISDGLTINKTGSSQLTLSGTNTFTGGCVINAGILSGTSDAAFGAVPGSVTPASITIGAGTLQSNNNYTLSSNRGITLTSSLASINAVSTATLTYGGVITGAFGITYSGTSGSTVSLTGVNTYTLNTVIGPVNLRIFQDTCLGTPPSSFTALGIIFTSSLATLRASASFTLNVNRGIRLTTNGSLGCSTSATFTVPSIIDDAGTAKGLVISGSASGVVILSGVNTYTGPTTVTNGVLSVTGSLHASSAVTCGGALLQGTGTVNGIVTVNNTAGSSISGGTGAGNAGNLTTGALTFNGTTATLTVNTNGTTACSTVTSIGAVTLGGVTVNFSGALNAGTYTVISGSSMSGIATQGTVATGRTWTSLTVVGNNLVAVLA